MFLPRKWTSKIFCKAIATTFWWQNEINQTIFKLTNIGWWWCLRYGSFSSRISAKATVAPRNRTSIRDFILGTVFAHSQAKMWLVCDCLPSTHRAEDKQVSQLISIVKSYLSTLGWAYVDFSVEKKSHLTTYGYFHFFFSWPRLKVNGSLVPLVTCCKSRKLRTNMLSTKFK